jgi:hypothetical protein
MQTPAVNLWAHFGCLLRAGGIVRGPVGSAEKQGQGLRQAMLNPGVMATSVLPAGFRFCARWSASRRWGCWPMS